MLNLIKNTLTRQNRRNVTAAPVVQRTKPAARWARGTDNVRRRFTVSGVVQETPTCVTLKLKSHGDTPFTFEAGQYLTFNIPANPSQQDGAAGATMLRRPYSLSGIAADSQPQITVKAIPDGAASGWLNHELKVGDALEAVGPAGDFTSTAAQPGQQRFLLVAGGVGITPVFSLLRHWLASDTTVSIRMIYCNRSRDDVIFADELAALADDPRLDLLLHNDVDDGVLTVGDFDALVADWLDADAYVCGPTGLMELAESRLAAAGMAKKQIHSERFLSNHNAQRPSEPQTIHFVRSNREVIQQPGETILQAALRDGLELPYSCTMGGCAHCRQKKLNGSGTIVMDEPNCLTPNEVEQGDFLACCAYATGPVEINA